VNARKPGLILRISILLAGWAYAWIEHNPLVRLIADLGLSPSPLERLFGIRGLFSGMTEASHQLARFDVPASLRANVLTIPLLVLAAIVILRWQAPTLATRRREMSFFAIAVVGTLINNLAPALFEL
jgi:hypothetical protein